MATKIRKSTSNKQQIRFKRKTRIRAKIEGSATMPRLAVFRSNKHIYVQAIDDVAGRTLASASTMDASLRGADGDKSALARQVGALIADRAKAAGVTAVVLDRGGNRYAGRIAALADGAREGGLDF